jgi:TPR repeat protein
MRGATISRSVGQHNLGIHYSQGWGVEENLQEAFAYFREAAMAHDANAQYSVASAYYKAP